MKDSALPTKMPEVLNLFFFSAKKKKRERNPQKLSSSHERQAASAVLVCGYLRSQHKARAAQPAVPNPEQTS